MQTTAAKRAFVLDRDRDQRLGQGGSRTLVSYEIVGTITGSPYGHWPPPKGPGPLDGEYPRAWKAIFTYSDGTTWEAVGPGASRGVPALA